MKLSETKKNVCYLMSDDLYVIVVHKLSCNFWQVNSKELSCLSESSVSDIISLFEYAEEDDDISESDDWQELDVQLDNAVDEIELIKQLIVTNFK